MSLRAAVLGHPISHSKSPALHLAAYGKLGMDIAYTALDLTEQALPAFMEQVRTQQGWRGLSVTMPLKSGMFAEVDEVRGVARTLGVVNTVAFEEDLGSVRRIGYNTDVAGIVNAVLNAGVAASPAAVVLGGGGTAAAAVAALKDLGTQHAQVFVREISRADEARAWRRRSPRWEPEHPVSSWTWPMIRGPARLRRRGSPAAVRWCPGSKCCCTRRWNRYACSPAAVTTLMRLS